MFLNFDYYLSFVLMCKLNQLMCRRRRKRRSGKKIDRRERDETDFGGKGCYQNAAFQVRILTFVHIFFPLLTVSRTSTTRARRANCRVHAFLVLTLYQKNIIISFNLSFLCRGSDHINVWVKPACVIRFSCLVNTTC